jgi:hypothetical protein
MKLITCLTSYLLVSFLPGVIKILLCVFDEHHHDCFFFNSVYFII